MLILLKNANWQLSRCRFNVAELLFSSLRNYEVGKMSLFIELMWCHPSLLSLSKAFFKLAWLNFSCRITWNVSSLMRFCRRNVLFTLTSFWSQREIYVPMSNLLKVIIIQTRSQHSQECKDPRRNVCVTRDLDLWPFNPKINGVPWMIVRHFYVKFGDPSCIGFWDMVRKKQT